MEFGKPLYEITFYLKQTQLQKKKNLHLCSSLKRIRTWLIYFGCHSDIYRLPLLNYIYTSLHQWVKC